METDFYLHIAAGLSDEQVRGFSEPWHGTDLPLFDAVRQTPSVWVCSVDWFRVAQGLEPVPPLAEAIILAGQVVTIDEAYRERLAEAELRDVTEHVPGKRLDFFLRCHKGRKVFFATW